MKKSTIEKIEKEIDEKTKMPYEIKDKIKKEVFTNIVVAGIIITYFIFIVLGSIGSIKNVRTIDLNIFSFLFLGIAIFLFEIAYRKDDGKLAIYGIESLVVAIFTLFLPYIIFELDGTNKKYYLMASIYIAAYYILKSIIISAKTKSKYMNSNISDVKEIVKKEKTKRRIKEDIEEIEIKDKNNKKGVGVDDPVDPQQKQTKKTATKKEPTKKTSTKTETKTKKETTAKSIKENDKNESTPKKRGRPKKTKTANSENKPKEETAPKKRGRPRKAVTSND